MAAGRFLLCSAASATEPSEWSICMYETVKCPTYKPDTANEKPGEWIVACDPKTSLKYLLFPARLVGTDVRARPRPSRNPDGHRSMGSRRAFTGSGQKKFTQLTKERSAQPPTNQVAIVLDGVVQCAPVTNDVITGRRIDHRQLHAEGSDEPRGRAEIRRPAARLRPRSGESISATLGPSRCTQV